MKTKIFNAVCKTRYLALLVVLIFTCGNAWGAIDANSTWTATAFASLPADATVIILNNFGNAIPNADATNAGPGKIAASYNSTTHKISVSTAGKTLDDIVWTTAKTTNGTRFWVYGSNTKLLGLSGPSSNTAVRVNTTTSASYNEFVMGSGGKLLKHYNVARYVGEYVKGSDWRSYNSETADNYKSSGTDQQLTFYVLDAACKAPDHVTITGTNKYLGGQTISLTAAPTGGTGTPSYQWQKKINGTWTNLANGGSISGATSNNLQISSCGYGNSGGYRCIVSTGEGCETKSHADNTDGYGVHVFSLNGGYYGGDWSAHDITWTSGTTGTATVHLNASSTYMFKVYSNHGYYYGNGENNYIIQPVSWDCGTGNNDMRLFTGPEGDYTFTVNIEHGLDGSPYVNVQVGYPTVSHPSTGYIYISKWWDCYVHYWEGTNNDLTTWGSDPKIDENRYATICGNNYWYFPVIATYNKFIAKDNAGNPGNTTGDQVTTSHGGMYITHDGNAWVWRDFSTYTISYAGGGGTGSMSSHTNLCPGSSQALTANTFSKTHYTFDGWHANVNVKVGGSTITAGNKINNSVTLQDIQSNVNLTAQWAANSYTVTTNLTNVTPNSAFPASVTYTGTTTTALNRTLTVNTTNFSLPTSITVSMAGTGTLTQGTHYTYNNSTGAFAFNVAVTGNITITATAVAKLMSIAITTQPTKRTYFAGETFSSTGAVVTATWGDASTTNVTGSATWTPAGALSAGTSQTVTATYSGKTATTTINVYSVTVNKVDEGGTAIAAAGVTATWTVGSKALTASAGSTNYVFKNWEFSGSNNGLAISNTNSASTTVTGTPTGNVTINAVFYNPVTITWSNNGVTSTTTTAYNTKPTLPSTPASCHPTSTTFIGWATSPWDGTLDDVSDKTIHTTNSSMSAATSATTYYAVFAKQSGSGSPHYAKVTSTGDITNGDYLIVYETESVAFNGSLSTIDATSNYINVTISDSKITANSTVNASKFTIDVTYKYIKSASNKYINKDKYENGLDGKDAATSVHSMSIDGSGNFVVEGTGESGGAYVSLRYNSNSDQKRFRFYKSGQKDIQLYKYDPGVSYSKYLTTCCENIMDLTAGATDATTHCTSVTFSNDNLPTCSDEPTDRQVTITITPYDGYAAPAELTYSGAGTATYVSGPTGSGPYTYVYEFDKDDDGDGTFTATCTPKAISLVLDKNNSDVSGSADGSATVYFDATSLSTISHATRLGHVLDGYYAEPGCTNKVLTDAGELVNYTGYVVSGKWARATTPTTLYAKWIAKSFEDYKFSCAELTLTAHPETAGAPIFITSVADKKVRSQGYITITGNGLTPSTALTFPGLNSKFEVLTSTGGAISTDGSGNIDVNAYIFYTPGADETTDGLLKITGLTVAVDGAKPKQVSLTQDIIGRHISTDFVIAAKNTSENKWYALPADMSRTGNPEPVEIAVDDINNPTIAYTAASNVYNLYLSADKEKVQLGMKNNVDGSSKSYALWANNAASSTDIGKNTGLAENTLGNNYKWTLTQTNTSITNPQDAKYTISNLNNVNPLKAWFTAGGGPKWGLYANGVAELRLIPASDIVFTEAYFVEWGQHGGVVEVDATGIDATSVVAHLGEATSSAITLSQTGTSVKGSATKYNYTVNFGEGIDFAAAASNGALLRLEWKKGEAVKAMTSLVVPKIIATSATMSSLMDTDNPWNSADVHVLPGVTLTANAGDFSSKDVVVDRLEIYPGATVKVTKGAQDVGTLKVRTLVLRNGWTRVGEKTYDVARLYVYTDANLAKNANDNVWYSDWYIDYDQYYPMAVPFPVATNSITYKNTKSAATAGVKIRYYDGARRAEHEQQDQDDNWVAYTWGDGGTMPENLAPSTGYAMTAKRPSGKAFSIVRMPMTFTNPWTALGEHGYVGETHKDQVSVTGWGKGTAEWYAMGWNFVANPYMCTFNGNDDGISGKITTQEGGDIKYATIPDLDFQNYYQVPIAEANLKPASAFFIQADNAEPQTITFNAGKIVPPSAPARYMTKNEAIPEQEAYIRLSHGEEKDLMGLIIGEDYTAAYEPNADLAKIQGGGNTVKTYMRYSDMDMAYVAINATLAKEWIPVTVNLPADGEYTFSLTNSSTVDALDGVYLIDYKNENTITNLIDNDYVFTAEAGTISDRFAINAIYGERETPTGLDAIEMGTIDPDKPIKFLYHEKVYILYQGVIYDAVGKKVREINN